MQEPHIVQVETTSEIVKEGTRQCTQLGPALGPSGPSLTVADQSSLHEDSRTQFLRLLSSAGEGILYLREYARGIQVTSNWAPPTTVDEARTLTTLLISGLMPRIAAFLKHCTLACV